MSMSLKVHLVMNELILLKPIFLRRSFKDWLKTSLLRYTIQAFLSAFKIL